MKILDKLKVKYTTEILSNNIRLDVFEKENSPINLRISILCGDALNNVKENKGIAHFTEHIFLAGTKMFPSKDKIALFLDQFGGSFAGTTNQEKHWLDLKVASKEYVENMFIVLQEILKNSLVSEKIIETERGSIISEYKGKYSKNEQKIHRQFSEQVFAGTEYVYPTLGIIDNIEKFNTEDIKNFIKTNLVGGKIGIIISGDISFDEAKLLTEKFLYFIPKSDVQRVDPSKQIPLPENFDKNNQIKFVEANEDVSNIKIGFRTPGLYHKFHYEYFLINNIFGTRRGSILNTILRYDKGLVYSAGSGFQNNSNSGFFSINTSCKTENTLNVIKEIINLIKTDVFSQITEERFNLEKQRILISNKTSKESSADWIDYGWTQITTTENRDFNFYLDQIEKLEFSNIVLALNEMFKYKNIYVTYSNKVNLDNDILGLLENNI